MVGEQVGQVGHADAPDSTGAAGELETTTGPGTTGTETLGKPVEPA